MINFIVQYRLLLKQDATLSRGRPHDAAVHFDRYQILQRYRVVSLFQHAFLVGLCLQTAVNYLSPYTGALKISRVPEYTPTATFSEIFNGKNPVDPMNVRTKFKFRSFTPS